MSADNWRLWYHESMVKVIEYIREVSRGPWKWLLLNSSERQALHNMREYRDAVKDIKQRIAEGNITSAASWRTTHALHLLQDATKNLKD